MLPSAFRPPDDADLIPAWLSWLDEHRLAPAAARALVDTPLPEDARAHLDAAHARARAQWLLYRAALQRFLQLMTLEPQQPVILLKGAALALTLYDDPATRPMNDIDLLVGPDHLAAVVKRMREAGYAEHSLGAGDDVGYLHHFIFSGPATGMRFEIHRTLPLLPNDTSLSWFLDQTEAHELAGRPFLSLTPAAQLLHAAAHAVLEHGGVQGAVAIWFYDIDQLIRHRGEEIDWNQTIAQARTLAWEAALQEAIRIARRYFATPVPAPIQAWMQQPARDLRGYDLLQQMTVSSRSSSLIIFHILRGLTWRERSTQLLHMLFPSRTYMQRRYDSIPWLLAYPYRWFDAARKLLPALFQKQDVDEQDERR